MTKSSISSVNIINHISDCLISSALINFVENWLSYLSIFRTFLRILTVDKKNTLNSNLREKKIRWLKKGIFQKVTQKLNVNPINVYEIRFIFVLFILFGFSFLATHICMPINLWYSWWGLNSCVHKKNYCSLL